MRFCLSWFSPVLHEVPHKLHDPNRHAHEQEPTEYQCHEEVAHTGVVLLSGFNMKDDRKDQEQRGQHSVCNPKRAHSKSPFEMSSASFMSLSAFRACSVSCTQ